jgi:serine/threonine protein kinase
MQATLDENPNFALKHLRHNSSEDFRTEVENLKRFSAKDHLHLIKLLVTFSWGEQYYLLFPWADGNLLDFWKSNPKPSNPLLGHQVALWFSKQCLGIVEGLKMIHTLDTPLTGDLSDVSSRQIHGRHGDLKPENILWFKSYQDTDTSCFMGVLKISDFGLTRFHGPMSKSHVDARGLGMSPTYRAPEYDIGKQVSQSYDIWTLGCVLLEFVTWYLLGWDEVDIFSKERTLDDDIEFKDLREDAFFNYVKLADDNGRIGARAKKSVADVSSSLLSC